VQKAIKGFKLNGGSPKNKGVNGGAHFRKSRTGGKRKDTQWKGAEQR